MTHSPPPSADRPRDHDRSPSGPAGGGQNSRVQIGSPAGVLAVVPHLLGFHPASSLVVLGISGRRAQIRLAFRYDLPDPPDPSLAAEIAAHATKVITRQHIGVAIIVGYGPGTLVTPLADLLRALLPAAGISIRELLRVESGRYWSYVCQDPACCPPEGVPFDAAGHPAALALHRAGLAAYPDRAALAGTLAALPGAAASMRPATARGLRRAEQLAASAAAEGRDAAGVLAQAGRRAVRDAIGSYRAGGQISDHDQLAWLTVVLADLRVRDDAWARMEPCHRAAHRRLWADLVRHAQPDYVPAPACLLAFTAWQSGDGALASVAIERALGADPGYSMALLLAEAIQAGLPPSAARLPMTPEQVAASYAGAGPGPAGAARPRAPAPEMRKSAPAGSAAAESAAARPGTAER
ncbi:MAG TPA: DUF4192 domain-containing protein [Streptosporangiaceae bacterium]|nr:DUF4192 domain-containing protein [Streptosporangiaceae bacterium]